MAKVVVKKGKGPIEYPPDHKPGMKVPNGGSSCSSCEYWSTDKVECTNKYFIKWNGNGKIPNDDPTSYCSDWYEEA